jgi:hypothetical protein
MNRDSVAPVHVESFQTHFVSIELNAIDTREIGEFDQVVLSIHMGNGRRKNVKLNYNEVCALAGYTNHGAVDTETGNWVTPIRSAE